tara:strand:- start:4117 stop:5760 length:1644 start_codon:yes stop_codon:yes gene_type:complete
MSNRIKIKRNSSSDFDATTLPSGLHYGELAFQNKDSQLFIGRVTVNDQADDAATTVHLPLLSDLTYGNGISGTVAAGNTDNSATISLDIGNINTAITSGLHNTQDHFALSDNGSLKKITFGNLKNEIYAGVTGGDVLIASGGAATIQADSVEGTMLNTNVADTSTLELSSNTLSVLKTPYALTAGTGLSSAGGTFDGGANRTFTVSATQTGITSLTNDNLRVGSGDGTDHYLDFSTDNEIRLSKHGGTVFLKVVDDTQDKVIIGDGSVDVDFIVDDSSGSEAFKVQASDGAVTIAGALTTGSLSTTNLVGTNVVANTYKYNNNGSAGQTAFTIDVAGNVSFVQALALASNLQVKTGTGGRLRLYTGETDVQANDVLGGIDFAAPDEATVGDARLLAASIEAVAAGTFSSSSNATKLVFKVGNSEAASEAMTIDNNKKVTIEGDLQVKGTTTTVDSTVVVIEDPIFTLGGADDAGSDDEKDRGIEFKWHTGSAPKTGFFGMDEDDNTFTFIPEATVSSETYSGTLGNAKFGSVAASAITGATINGGTY